jgi:hypothetical protein
MKKYVIIILCILGADTAGKHKRKKKGMGGETPLPFFWVELGYIYLIFYLHFAPQSD